MTSFARKSDDASHGDLRAGCLLGAGTSIVLLSRNCRNLKLCRSLACDVRPLPRVAAGRAPRSGYDNRVRSTALVTVSFSRTLSASAGRQSARGGIRTGVSVFVALFGASSWFEYRRRRVSARAKANERSPTFPNNRSVRSIQSFPQSPECFGRTRQRPISRLRPIVRCVQPRCISPATVSGRAMLWPPSSPRCFAATA